MFPLRHPYESPVAGSEQPGPTPAADLDPTWFDHEEAAVLLLAMGNVPTRSVGTEVYVDIATSL